MEESKDLKSTILKKDDYVVIEDETIRIPNAEDLENREFVIGEHMKIVVDKIEDTVVSIASTVNNISNYGNRLAEIKNAYRLKEKMGIK